MHIIQAFWGARDVIVDDLARRVGASLTDLHQLGGALGGPWRANNATPVIPTDLSTIVSVITSSPVTDDAGAPEPESGFAFSLMAGDWVSSSESKAERAKVRVSALVNSSLSSVVMKTEGSTFTEQVERQSAALVESFARRWQPDAVAVMDRELLNLHYDLAPRSFPRRQLVPWGYVAWISDRYSRQLDEVSGATTQRLGTGTLVQTNSDQAADAADVWLSLIASKRLRPLGDPQTTPPEFLPVTH